MGYISIVCGMLLCFTAFFDYIPLHKIQTDEIVHEKYIGQAHGSAYPMVNTHGSHIVNQVTFDIAEVGKPLVIYESSIWAWIAGFIGFVIIFVGWGWTRYDGSALDYH